MKLDLPNITAVCLQGRDIKKNHKFDRYRIEIGLRYMVKFFNFKEIIFINCYDPEIDGITFIHTNPISYHDYNRWCIIELTNYVKTDYCLLFQDDGFPLHPELWDNEFLNYDYVGAPLPLNTTVLHNKIERITGGGFTLRSKKLLNLTATWVNYPSTINEDTYITVINRNELINNGLKICPHQIAKKFVLQNSIDDEHTIDKVFGYHGRDNKMNLAIKIMIERL